jgi:F-type H+-transporting ATPase subunit delta
MPTISHETLRHETVMDITGEQVARVYAQAFLGVVMKAPNPAELIAELQSLMDEVFDKFPKFAPILTSSFISHEQREQMIERVLGTRASVMIVNFLKVLSAHDRINCLRPIVREVARRYREESGQVDVKLYVARPIEDQTLLNEIASAIQKSLGKVPALTIVVDPSLIAGFVIRVGDTVYDGSVKTRFEQARRTMIERSIEAIETNRNKLMD